MLAICKVSICLLIYVCLSIYRYKYINRKTKFKREETEILLQSIYGTRESTLEMMVVVVV